MLSSCICKVKFYPSFIFGRFKFLSPYLTQAKNLLTLVSSRRFQLEPPKSLLHFALSKGSTAITRYLFLTNNIQQMFSLRKLLRNTPYLSRGVSQQRIPNGWFLLRNLLEEDILLAVEESISHGTAPNYHQSPQESQGVTHAWFAGKHCTIHFKQY